MLLRRLSDALIIFHKGSAEYFDGNYDDFLEKIGWEEEGTSTNTPKKKKCTLSYKEQKKERNRLTQERNKEAAPFKKETESCEARITTLEKELETENKTLEEATKSADNTQMIDAAQKVANINDAIEVEFEKMAVATEAWDGIKAKYKALLESLS
jgi:ATP-binding cassette subfamily F protein 3